MQHAIFEVSMTILRLIEPPDSAGSSGRSAGPRYDEVELHNISQNQNQKWFNKEATEVHQPITVIQNDMASLYSKK